MMMMSGSHGELPLSFDDIGMSSHSLDVFHGPDVVPSSPSFADEEEFIVEVERRFLLWYKCIRRTKPVTIDQVRTGNHCALSLYDGQHSAEMLEDKIEIGEITFTLRSDASSEAAWSQSSTAYSHNEYERHRVGEHYQPLSTNMVRRFVVQGPRANP